jgi:hypothetical protein
MTRRLDSSGPVPTRRSPGLALASVATALAAALVTGLTGPRVAQSASFDPTTTPLANRIYAGCQLSSGTATALDHNVAFVVVYSLKYDNDGQPLVNGSGTPTGEYTGPVICRASGVSIANTTQTTAVSGTVDTLSIEDVYLLRYIDGSDTNKSLCGTVADNTGVKTECFQFSPGSGTAPGWVALLQDDIQQASSIGTLEIAFVAVHALTGGSVILTNDAVAAQTSGPTPTSAIDTLDAEDEFVLAYRPTGSGDKKVICHTVDANTDCFRISSP